MLYDNFDFEWDQDKNNKNLKKHGIYFAEAETTRIDTLAIEIPDPDHSDYEERWIRIGYSMHFRLLVTVFTELNLYHYRIISSRKATKNEVRMYHER